MTRKKTARMYFMGCLSFSNIQSFTCLKRTSSNFNNKKQQQLCATIERRVIHLCLSVTVRRTRLFTCRPAGSWWCCLVKQSEASMVFSRTGRRCCIMNETRVCGPGGSNTPLQAFSPTHKLGGASRQNISRKKEKIIITIS